MLYIISNVNHKIIFTIFINIIGPVINMITIDIFFENNLGGILCVFMI